MRLAYSMIYRRTEDAGSAGCPPQAVGCTTNPDMHDLTPAQASSLSQSLAASSASATSTSLIESETHQSTGGVNPQAVGGIIVIVFLVVVFTMAICYVAFGVRGERCCCTTRKNRKRQAAALAHVEADMDTATRSEVNSGSQAQLIQASRENDV